MPSPPPCMTGGGNGGGTSPAPHPASSWPWPARGTGPRVQWGPRQLGCTNMDGMDGAFPQTRQHYG
eukprot:6617762-Pyramimonas_sp.AAC.1